ncbi:MAG: hypothetical protein A2W23_02325 [Planctomycetes bacterium RBG_16_43_13]|nr:MAG: hypothetical protein A2W23_02325 [Planctomycetes bacterium RBG_16_43_13]
MRKKYHSAEVVRTREGEQYHIGLKPGDLAEYILLCGDVDRANKIAHYFDKIELSKSNREFVTFTGAYKGIPLSVMGTGIGPDNTEIAVIEISQIVKNPTFIRLGSCGALQKDIKIGELIVTTASVRLENTSLYFVDAGYPAVANYEIVLALIQGCEKVGAKYSVGLTASAPGFYGAQSRHIGKFKPLFPNLPNDLAEKNVLNFEMETSALFTLSSIGGFRAGAVCAVFANRHNNKFIDSVGMAKADALCIKAGLSALEVLAEMDKDKKRRNAKYWYPKI